MPDYTHRYDHLKAMMTAALHAADPRLIIRDHIHKNGDQLTIGSHKIDRRNGRLFVVSLGKAALPMAEAAVEILGKASLFGGAILTKFLPETAIPPIPAYEGNHPVPGAKSVAGSMALLQTVANLAEDDLVLCFISGGASSLFTRPRLPLETWQALNQALLASGCPIEEINTVRRQLDSVKGGGLARWVAPARMITLALSDVVGNRLAAIGSGPTVFVKETPADALSILSQYGVLELMETAVSQTIQNTLRALAKNQALPPDNVIDNIVIGSIKASAEAAAEEAKKLGFHTRLLTTCLEGEAREAGRFVAALAKDAPPLSATLLGGETTVTLRGRGIGGRNLETALAAAIHLEGWPHRAVTSFATDGDDGPSGMAGATITGQTVTNRRAALAHLNNNDSYHYFQQLDSAGHGPHLINMGPTGTNVNDLIIILNYEKG